MKVDKVIDTDVLIIGGGGAAMRVAVAACDAGAATTVVLKGQRGRSGATVAYWGTNHGSVAWQMADDCSEDDSPDIHLNNILDVGLGMADPRLARILAYEIGERSAELESWGMRFISDPTGQKRHYSGYSCFGNRPRAHGIANSGYGHAGDVVKVLIEQIRRRDVTVHENTFITDLLVINNTCVGALALGSNGQIVAYRAGAVVLGAGGARQMFPLEPDRPLIDTTGDGYAMALRAGARLTNMEFTQYMLHPVLPFPLQSPGIFWALFPQLKNRHGQDALTPHLPSGVTGEQVMIERTLHFPFSSRDISKWLDIAIATEIKEGRGTEQNALYLDFSAVKLGAFKPSRPQHMPEDTNKPVVLPEGLLQVRPAAHAINGGVIINEQAATTLPGLYAAAEVAAGPHGADRLGGGMVSGGQVFGARAGKFAAEYALDAGLPILTPECLELPLARLQSYNHGQKNANDVLAALQAATGELLMVTRSERGLTSLLGRVKELTTEWLPQIAVNNSPQALRRAIEVENSLLTAELMTRAALMRRESRGSHYREDYPRQNDEQWGVNIIFGWRGGALSQQTGLLETTTFK